MLTMEELETKAAQSTAAEKIARAAYMALEESPNPNKAELAKAQDELGDAVAAEDAALAALQSAVQASQFD